MNTKEDPQSSSNFNPTQVLEEIPTLNFLKTKNQLYVRTWYTFDCVFYSQSSIIYIQKINLFQISSKYMYEYQNTKCKFANCNYSIHTATVANSAISAVSRAFWPIFQVFGFFWPKNVQKWHFLMLFGGPRPKIKTKWARPKCLRFARI